MSSEDYPLENQIDIIHVPCSAHLAFVSKDYNTGVLFYICPVCKRKFVFGEITEGEGEGEGEETQPPQETQPQTEKKPRKRRKQAVEAQPEEPQAEQPQETGEKNDNAPAP